ncbi:hypothetical protein K438DRAFT_2000384 [Mycena galopus ATCC 62051]|nr:hypothetical protein K438DRAFT_2000384 [Mycena galopus ATCC 62051]
MCHRVLNQILTEMVGMNAKKSVIIIGATNMPDQIDSALPRPGRLDQLVYIPTQTSPCGCLSSRRASRSRPSRTVSTSTFWRGFSGPDLTEMWENYQRAVKLVIHKSIDTNIRRSREKRAKDEAVGEDEKMVKDDAEEEDGPSPKSKGDDEVCASLGVAEQRTDIWLRDVHLETPAIRAANDTVNSYDSSLLSLTLCPMPGHHLIGLLPHTNGTQAPNREDSELANATAPSPGPDVHETNLSRRSELQDEFLSIDEFIKPYLKSLEESVVYHHNFPATMSFSDSEEERVPNRAFTIPDQNATPNTLRKAVVESHKLLGAALKKNKALTAEVAELKASQPAGRRKTKEVVSSEAYDSMIINLGKSFTLLHFPWVDSTAFTEQNAFPNASPTEIWKAQPPSQLFPKHLTAMLYQHIPNEYHSHVAKPARFGTLFCHHASAGRSTALKAIKENIARIVLNLKVIPDVNDTLAWRALVLWPEDMNKDLKCARVILFGPASLNNNGSGRPRGVTLGQMWQLMEPTPGLVAFVCTMVVFICYWSSVPRDTCESFEPVGTTSKINWREVYMRFRWALESKAEEESTKAIMSFWHEHLFKGITGVPALPPTRSVTSEYIDEEAELEDAMGDMSLGESTSSDGEGLATHPATANNLTLGPAPALPRPDNAAAQRHPAPPADADEEANELPGSPLRPLSQRAHPAPPADIDEELDESLASPLRPINQRAHGRHIINSEDEGAPEDIGGHPADLRLGLEDKLKKLKVADLKAILQDAERPPRAKAVKSELIASIMADDATIHVYLTRFPV